MEEKIRVFRDVTINNAPYYRGGTKILPLKHTDEEFRDYPLNPMYMVSNYGRVYCKRGYMVTPFILRRGKEGYVMAKVDTRNTCVHRMVGLTFDYNPNHAELEINHIDGHPRNNYYKNLEWCTHPENIKHSYTANLVPLGEDKYNAVFTNEEIDKICSLIVQGLKPLAISKIVNRDFKQIAGVYRRIKDGISWKGIAAKYGIGI